MTVNLTPQLEELVRSKVASGKASVSDFNWKKPRLKLLTSKAADKDAELQKALARLVDLQKELARHEEAMENLRQRLPGYLTPRLVRERPGQPAKTPVG